MEKDFAALHHGERPLLLPNAWDHASGAALAARGFPAVGTTSLGVAAAAGLRDGAGLTRAETVLLAEKLRRLPCLVTVDLEAGFSEEPGEVAALASELAESGVVGVNIEDGRGEALADPRHQQELVSAIKNAVPSMFVNARTDTHWLRVGGDDEALSRARAYLRAGADGIFVPGMSDEKSIAMFVSEVSEFPRASEGSGVWGTGVPVNILFSPNGPSLRRLAELGVRRVSCGSLLFRAALDAALRTVSAIADGDPVPAGIIAYDEIQSLT